MTFTPSSEKDRLRELQLFVSKLQIRTHLQANSISNFYPVTAYLPKERDAVISELQNIIDTVDEKEMVDYRNSLEVSWIEFLKSKTEPIHIDWKAAEIVAFSY